MPALVNRSVGSSPGTSDEERTRVWPLRSKYFKNVSRSSWPFIGRPIVSSPFTPPGRCPRSRARPARRRPRRTRGAADDRAAARRCGRGRRAGAPADVAAPPRALARARPQPARGPPCPVARADRAWPRLLSLEERAAGRRDGGALVPLLLERLLARREDAPDLEVEVVGVGRRLPRGLVRDDSVAVEPQ